MYTRRIIIWLDYKTTLLVYQHTMVSAPTEFVFSLRERCWMWHTGENQVQRMQMITMKCSLWNHFMLWDSLKCKTFTEAEVKSKVWIEIFNLKNWTSRNNLVKFTYFRPSGCKGDFYTLVFKVSKSLKTKVDRLKWISNSLTKVSWILLMVRNFRVHSEIPQ